MTSFVVLDMGRIQAWPDWQSIRLSAVVGYAFNNFRTSRGCEVTKLINQIWYARLQFVLGDAACWHLLRSPGTVSTALSSVGAAQAAVVLVLCGSS